MAEVPVAVDLRRLAPHHLEAVEARLVRRRCRAPRDPRRRPCRRRPPRPSSGRPARPPRTTARAATSPSPPWPASTTSGTPATATRSPVSASRRWSVPLRSVMSRSPVSGRNAIAHGSSSRSSSSTANGQPSSPSPAAGPSEPEAAVSPEQAVASTVSSPASAGARGFMGPWCAGVASAAPVGEGCRGKTSKKSP